MNRKQLVSMWCGILAIVFFALVMVRLPHLVPYANFCVYVFLITLVTSGLIYTFRDKKRPEGKARRPTNVIRGLKRITLVLSLLSALLFLVFGILNALYGEWNDVPSCLFGCLAAFCGVWIIYCIIRWVIKGFYVDIG